LPQERASRALLDDRHRARIDGHVAGENADEHDDFDDLTKNLNVF